MDEPNYPSHAVAFAHPARLAAQAMQRGLRVGFDETFSYLELGCGAGGNLLPLAARFPDASFVGVDHSASAIAAAEKDRAALGLSNLRLVAHDISHLDEAGPYDYVVAHGVYSWVPPQTQGALLAAIKRALAPQGVALVSYNTRPGWGVRGLVRDTARRAAEGELLPRAKLKATRLALGRLLRAIPGEHPYATLLQAELSLALGKKDGYLLGEYLAEHNEALYVTEFLERAGSAGLGFLAEGVPATADGVFELSLEQEASGRSLTETLWELDLLSYRQFRATSLSHAEAPLQPLSQAPLRERGYLSAQLTPLSREPLLAEGEALSFRTELGAVLSSTGALHKAALLCLARAYPRGLRLAELLTSALEELMGRGLGERVELGPGAMEQLQDDLLELARRRQLELLPWSPRVSTRVTETSSPAALTRLEAARGVVTSARHHAVEISPLHAELLQLMGRSSGSQVMATLHDLAAAGELTLGEDERDAFTRPGALAELISAQLRASVSLGLFPEVEAAEPERLSGAP